MASADLRKSFVNSRASIALDAIRGIAALLVTVQHLRQRFFFLAYAELPHRSVPLRLLYLFGDFGSFAVIVFFVLSGFLVGGSLIRAHEKGSWGWGSYLLHRFIRLWIVLIPALLLGFLFDSLQIHSARGHIVPSFVAARVAEDAANLTLRTFLGNVFFLQTIYVPVFGSNGALWSLANEFWYYILFPLGFFALVVHYKPVARILLFALFALIARCVGLSILLGAPLWLFGALLHYVPVAALTSTIRRTAIAIYLAVLLALLPLSYHFPIVGNYVLAVATCVLLWVLLSDRAPADSTSLPTRSIRLLARFSYTLYLIHTPIFYLVAVNLVHGAPWQPTPAHIGIAVATWFATIAFALLVASATEFRTDQVRRAIERTLTPAGVQPA